MFIIPLSRISVRFLKPYVRYVNGNVGKGISLKIGLQNFELSLDLRGYQKDEINVKAHPNYVIVEGKKERETIDGTVITQFSRKYKLPKGCKIDDMKSDLSPEGILTVSAPRTGTTPDLCEIKQITIDSGIMITEEKRKKRRKTVTEVCTPYPKVKAVPPKK